MKLKFFIFPAKPQKTVISFENQTLCRPYFQQINFGPQCWKFGWSSSLVLELCGLWFSCSNIKLRDGRTTYYVYFNEFMFKHITCRIFELSLPHLGRICEMKHPGCWKLLKGRTRLTMTIINHILENFEAIYKY